MVLQRSPSLANIWGWAPLQDVGSEVVVMLANSDRHEENFLYKTVVKAGEEFIVVIYIMCLAFNAV